MSLAEFTDPQPAAVHRWLSIVGIGEDGIEGLNATARELIQSAAVVFGGARHLALAASLIRGIARPWAVPFDGTVAEVLAHRGRAVCVLASGDPFFHGVGQLVVAPRVARGNLGRARAVGLQLGGLAAAVAAAANRAAVALRPPARSHPSASAPRRANPGAHLRPRSARAAGAAAVRYRLRSARSSRCSNRWPVRTSASARRAPTPSTSSASTRSTRWPSRSQRHPARAYLPRAAGLADDLFEHDGQITKREIRALTLSALAPRRGELLWDVGAGSGSVAIEWMLADESLNAIAIERRGERARAHRAQCRRLRRSAFAAHRRLGARGASRDWPRRMRYSSAAARPRRDSSMPRKRHCAPRAAWSSTP